MGGRPAEAHDADASGDAKATASSATAVSVSTTTRRKTTNAAEAAATATATAHYSEQRKLTWLLDAYLEAEADGNGENFDWDQEFIDTFNEPYRSEDSNLEDSPATPAAE